MKQQRSQIDYRGFFENMLDGLAFCQMIFDENRNPVDFVYLEVSGNFEKLTGLKEVLGRKVTEVIPGVKEASPELFEIYGRVCLTGQPERFEVYLKPLEKWFLISAYSSDKEHFTAVFQNITSRKQTEKKLEDAKIAAYNVFTDLNAEKNKLDEARAKEEAILASIADGVIAIDTDEKIILINQTAEKMLGYASGESLGKYWSEILHPVDEKGNPQPPEKEAFHAALSKSSETTTTTTTTTTVTESFYYLRKDGTKFPVSRTVSPIVLGGRVIGAINIFRDITREKAIDRAKTEFVSLASHQLRTPTTAISWYAKMLLNQEVGELNASQKKYLQNIYDGNRRIVKLVRSLLNVSRIELGTFTIQTERVNLAEVCQNLIIELKPEISVKKIKIKENYQNNLPEILADSKLVYIIFQNLLVNALVYTPMGGEITVSLSLEKQENASHFLITVADTGIGIPAGEQGKIFTKLFRADNAKEEVPDGTGLGLYMVKSILQHTNGKIWFESPDPKAPGGFGPGPVANRGTIFYVSLPLEGMQARNGDKGFL